MTEQFANNASSTLNGSIDNVTTTIVVTNGSPFSSTGTYRILIDSEIMLVTARSGQTMTVTRAQEGTSGAAHTSGAVVTQIITSGTIQQLKSDTAIATTAIAVQTGAYSTLPAAGTPGRLFLPTDGFSIYEDNGTTWRPFGPVLPLTTPPSVSTLTFVNQGSATAVDAGGGFIFTTDANGTGNSRHLLVKSAPSTPYTFTVGMYLQLWPAPQPTIGGLVFRESGTGKFVEFIMYFTGNTIHMATDKFTNPTTSAGAYDDGAVQPAISLQGLFFMRIQDDGTNLHFFWSTDGVNFLEWLSPRSRTDFMTTGPNQIGVIAQSLDTNATRIVKMNVIHWVTA